MMACRVCNRSCLLSSFFVCFICAKVQVGLGFLAESPVGHRAGNGNGRGNKRKKNRYTR